MGLGITSTKAQEQLPAVSFTDTGQLLGHAEVFTETCGDLDGDGNPDCMLASSALNCTIQEFQNNGDAVLTDKGQVFPVRSADFPLWNFGIVMADFDRDGDLDILAADAVRGVNIYFNDGTGSFLDLPQVLFDNDMSEIKGATAGDLDGDGDIDFVIGDFFGSDRVYFNDGSGTFYDSGQRLGNDYHTWKMALGDLDGDGDLDLVAASRWDQPLIVYFNDGNGQFTNPGMDLGLFDAYDVKLADVDADGDIDIIVGASIEPVTGRLSRIFLNDGSGHFTDSGQNLGVPNCETKEIGLGDLDNDGDFDLILGNYNYGNYVYLNDGSGNFILQTENLPSYNTIGMSLVDLDGDGYLDIISGELFLQGYKVYRNNSTLGFPNQSPSPPTELNSTVSGKTVTMQWSNGSDLETPQILLTYNLRVGHSSGSNDVFSGAWQVGVGNMGHSFQKVLHSLLTGTYYWSIQTVDSGFKCSDWSSEQIITISADIACTDWDDVMKKYQAYVDGTVTWDNVITCYQHYAEL